MLRLLLFFPSITFGLLAAEIFPWAIAYWLAARARLATDALLLYGLLALAAAAVVAQGLAPADEAVRSLSAFVNSSIVLLALMKVSEAEVRRLAATLSWVLGALLVLAVAQASGAAAAFEGVLKLLVPRGEATSLDDYRGVTLLATEPSRAGLELVFLYAGYRFVRRPGALAAALMEILLALVLVFLVRSAIGVMMFAVYLCLEYRRRAPWIAMALGAGAWWILAFDVGGRAADVLRTLAASTDLDGGVDFLLNTAGFRIVSLVAGYASPAIAPLGFGVGNWEAGSIAAMQAVGFDPAEIAYFRYFGDGGFVGVRATAVMASLALEGGLVALALYGCVLWRRLGPAWGADPAVRAVLALFGVGLFVVGAVGNPVPFVVAAVCARLSMARVPAASDARRPVPVSGALSFSRGSS